MVTAGMTVKVFDPSAVELKTFSVAVTEENNDTVTTSTTAKPAGNEPQEEDGFPVWGWTLIVVVAMLAVGGVIVAVVMRKRPSAS